VIKGAARPEFTPVFASGGQGFIDIDKNFDYNYKPEYINLQCDNNK
jgi:hypothetical protein